MTDAAIAIAETAPPLAPPGTEQRRNSAIRHTSQAAFTTLIDLLAAHGMEAVVANLRGLGQVEDVMRRCPAMVGLLLSLAWKFREAPLLTSFFAGPDGVLVSAEDQPIAPCGRTYQDIRKAHLLGTARVHLTKPARKGKSAGKTAPKPGLWQRVKSLFAKAPAAAPNDRASLFAALKPHLHHHTQFELIPVYATLSARQIGALGGLLPALTSAAAVNALSPLAPKQILSLRALVSQFAETVLADPARAATYMGLTAAFRTAGENALDDAVAGYALNCLLGTYADILPGLLADQDNSVAVIRRLAPAAGIDLWSIFRAPEAAVNVRFCPEPIAQILGHTARFIHDSVSAKFGDAKNLDALGLILSEILADLGPDTFARATAGAEHAKIWDSLVSALNRADNLDSGADLTLPKTAASLQTIAASALRSLHAAVAAAPRAKAA
ncbi:MAG: hypothetical protein JNK21_15360 [Rhodospirillaceae bacterium]|nr:hypothetical protein [Rhodospirillaceae bacterium]